MPFQPCENIFKLERLCVQKVDKHSRNSHKLKSSMKSLTFSCLICALNLYFAQILLRKTKTCSRLLEPQNLLQTSKVAEHNRGRPNRRVLTFDISGNGTIVLERKKILKGPDSKGNSLKTHLDYESWKTVLKFNLMNPFGSWLFWFHGVRVYLVLVLKVNHVWIQESRFRLSERSEPWEILYCILQKNKHILLPFSQTREL